MWLYKVIVWWIFSELSRMRVGVQASRNIWVRLVLIMGIMQSYIDGRRLVIGLKESIESWREATTLNNIKSLNSVATSLLICKFCAYSKTVFQKLLAFIWCRGGEVNCGLPHVPRRLLSHWESHRIRRPMLPWDWTGYCWRPQCVFGWPQRKKLVQVDFAVLGGGGTWGHFDTIPTTSDQDKGHARANMEHEQIGAGVASPDRRSPVDEPSPVSERLHPGLTAQLW